MLMSQQAGVVRATVLIANENESEHDSFRAMVGVAQAPIAIKRRRHRERHLPRHCGGPAQKKSRA